MSQLLRSDYDQAIRYLKGACEILLRAGQKTSGLRHGLVLMIERLSPDRRLAAPAVAVSVMPDLAKQTRGLDHPDAATEILKAVAVLRDKSR